jgi:hypothetical protein
VAESQRFDGTIDAVTLTLIDRVLTRRRRERRDRLDGCAVVRAGTAVPFDNVHKSCISRRQGAPLPGSTATDFERCSRRAPAVRAGRATALHDLPRRSASDRARRRDDDGAARRSAVNHGSVVVHRRRARSSTRRSCRVPRLAHDAGDTLPRIELRGDTHVIVRRTPRAPAGFACRIDRIGVSAND